MKSTIFRKILAEETIETDEPYSEAIRKLQEQSGICNQCDFNDRNLVFRCSPRGKFILASYREYLGAVRPWKLDRIYYMRGEVLPDRNKSAVKVYTIFNRLYLSLKILVLLMVIAWVLLAFFWEHEISISNIIIASVAIGILTVVDWVLLSVELKHKTKKIDLMQKEVRNRVAAMKRWDE